MNAAGHSLSGWMVALMIINWLSLFHDMAAAAMLGLSLAIAAAMAGSALWPDWDFKNSTISTSFGPASQLVHKGVVQLHYLVADLTKQGGDRKPPGPHRGVTHWWPTPLVTGILVAGVCYWNTWALFGVLVVLYTAAMRGLTVPDYMPKPTHTVRRRWSMQTTHHMLDLTPSFLIMLTTVCLFGSWLISTWFLFIGILIVLFLIPIHLLKRARKHVNRTHTLRFTYWSRLTVPVGKIMTIIVAATLAFLAIQYPWIVEHRTWLGVIVCLGMYLHILGDAPTEMGIPGRNLRSFWRLPKWLAFKAGESFEIVFLWTPMAALGIYLIPGLRPHAEVMAIQSYIIWGLSALTVAAFVIEASTRYTRRKVWK